MLKHIQYGQISHLLTVNTVPAAKEPHREFARKLYMVPKVVASCLNLSCHKNHPYNYQQFCLAIMISSEYPAGGIALCQRCC